MGLTGPFCIVLCPLFAWRAWERRSRSSLVLAAILCACAAVARQRLNAARAVRVFMSSLLDLSLGRVGHADCWRHGSLDNQDNVREAVLLPPGGCAEPDHIFLPSQQRLLCTAQIVKLRT